MRKYQISDENRVHRAILEVFTFLICAVHFFGPMCSSPEKKSWLRGWRPQPENQKATAESALKIYFLYKDFQNFLKFRGAAHPEPLLFIKG